MANLTKTLKNQVLDSLGPSPPNQWLSFKWTAAGVGPGNGTWGIKSAGAGGVPALVKSLFRTLSNSSMSVGVSCPAVNITKSLFVILNDSITPIYANSIKNLTIGGYTYVFPGEVTNIHQQNITNYSSQAAATSGWACGVAGVTVWS